MAGPNPPMVDPTKIVEITAVWVVIIVSWSEDDGGGGGSWKVYVQESLWSGCWRRRIMVNETQRGNERKGLTVRVCSSLPEDLIKGVTALVIKEIGMRAQRLRRVPGTRIFAEQLW